jgi:hypothetical protein
MCVFNVVDSNVVNDNGVVVCKYINEDYTYDRLCAAYPNQTIILCIGAK